MKKLSSLILLLLLALSVAFPPAPAAQVKLSGGAKLSGTVKAGVSTAGGSGILDNFNRADEGPPPSSNWTTGIGLSTAPDTNGHMVSSNVMVRSGGGTGESYWSAAQFGPNCEVFLTVANASDNGNIRLALRLRQIGSGTTDGYWVQFVSGNCQIWRTDDGAAASQLANNVFAVASGYKLKFEAIGSTLTVYVDTGSGWTQQLQATDSTYGAAGFIGLGTDTGCTFDDFGGGTLP